MSIRKLLKEASKAYYDGDPIMDDAEFDSLAKAVNWVNVGFESDAEKHPHYNRLYSLDTVFDLEQVEKLPMPIISSPKLDGAAVSLLYYEGRLVTGLTRGDGIEGTIITDKIKHKVPNTIKTIGLVQIVGEVVAPKTIKNSRNYVAGALNLKDVEEFKSRDLTFIAYNNYPHMGTAWTQDMEWLNKLGFNTVLQSDWNEFPQDGIVFRTDIYKNYKSLGYTSHHPRGAIALKKQAEGVVTTLLDVIWQVGKSGVVSPVAILEPVIVGDALVSKATLHNISYIEELNLEIGCKVEIIRSGEIIPRVVKRVDD